MANCSFAINIDGFYQEFSTEEALDSFLRKNKKQLVTSLLSGKVMFSTDKSIQAQMVDIIQTMSDKVSKDVVNHKYFVNDKELTSVTKFITSKRVVNGTEKFLVPKFNPKNILAKKKAELLTLLDNQNQPKYTEEQVDKILSDMMQGWELQSLLGTSFHSIAEGFFKGDITTPADIIELIPELEQNNFVTRKYIDSLTKFKERLIKDHGDDAVFLTETTIFDTNMNEKGHSGIAGTSDLIVIDSAGFAHIYDYKTSMKSDADWSDIKTLSIKYQLGFYSQILKRAGVKVKSVNFIPIHLLDIDYETKLISNFDMEPPARLYMVNGETISDNIAMVLPYTTLSTLEDTGDNKPIYEFLSKAFNYEQKKVVRGSSSLDQMYERVLQSTSDDGKSYQFYNLITNKFIYIAKTVKPEDIKATLETYLRNLDEYNRKLPMEFHDYVHYAKNAHVMGEKAQTESRWSKHPETITKLNNLLYKYIHELGWHPVESDLMYDLGIVAFENEFTNEIDFISLTASDLKEKVKLIRGNSMLGNVLTDTKAVALGAKKDWTIADTELMKMFALVKNNEEAFKGKKVGKMFAVQMKANKMIPAIATQTFDGLDEQWRLLKKHLPEFELAKTDWDVTQVNYYDSLIAFVSDLFDNPKFTFTLRDRELKEKFSGLADITEVNEKVKVLGDILKQLLETVGNLESVKYDRKDLARLATIISEAILQLENKSVIVEEDIKNWGSVIGENANITTPERIRHNLSRLTIDTVRTALDNAGHLFNENTKDFREMHAEFYRSRGATPVQIKTIGLNQPLFSKLMVKVNGKNIFRFKNTETDTSLTAADKKYINKFLAPINEIRRAKLVDKHGELSPELMYFDAEAKWNIPLMKTGMFSALLGKNTKEFVNDYFRDMINPNNIYEDDQTSNDKLSTQREMFNQFDYIDLDYEARDEKLNNSKDTDFETDLELIMATYLMTDAKQKAFNKVMPTINALKTVAMLSDINYFSDNDNTIKLIDNYIGTTLFGKSIVAGESKELAIGAKVFVDLASVSMLGLSPGSALTEFFTGAWGNVTRTLANTQHQWLFQKEDILKAIPLVSIDTSTTAKMSLNNISYSESINEMFQVAEMDLIQMSRDRQSTSTGLRNFKDKHMYGLNAIPNYLHRLVLINAQMIKDGIVRVTATGGLANDSAMQMVNGKLVYNNKLDLRFKAYLSSPNATGASQTVAWKEARARYETMKEMLAQEPGGLKADGSLARPYDNKMRDGLKSYADQVHGNYDADSKSHFQKTAFGQLFMQFKSWANAKKHRWFSPTDTKGRQGRYEIVYEDDGSPKYIWKGKMMEGIFQSFVGLASELKENRYNIIKTWDELDPTSKENFTWMISDLLLFGILTLLVGAIFEAIDREENPAGYIATRSLSNSSKDLWIGSTVSAFAGTKNPIAIFSWSSSVANDVWGSLTGDPRSQDHLLDNIGMWRTLSPLLFSGD